MLLIRHRYVLVRILNFGLYIHQLFRFILKFVSIGYHCTGAELTLYDVIYTISAHHGDQRKIHMYIRNTYLSYERDNGICNYSAHTFVLLFFQ